MAKLKKYLTWFLIAVLAFGWIGTCILKDKEKKAELSKQEQNYAAALKKWEKKDTVFVGKVIEAEPDDIVKSDVFAEFDSIKQAQIKELADKKALLAALEANLEIITKKIEILDYKLTNAVITDSSVTFPKGDMLVFEDTIGDYQYKESITFGDSIAREFKSSLKLNPSFTFQRNKDKSIDGTATFGNPEDTELNVTDVVAFYIPATDKPITHPKFHKFWVKAKPYAIGAAWGGSVILAGYGGFKTGVTISK